jgi:dynein intermediate chain 2
VPGSEEAKVLGCTRIEYNVEPSPMKYLAGTEQGYIFLANKKPGKAVEIIQRFGVGGGKHHGPIYALQRNPFAPKYFMSVGDWTSKIWSEELKTPIMQTKYHDSYLTDGCWSPQRPGLFYLTRMDGFIDIWDFYYRQNEVAYSQKISDNPLTCISIKGPRAALGDSEGSITLLSLCPSLYEPAADEKEEMIKIFDREAAREKNLEISKKLAEQKKPAKAGQDNADDKKRQKLEQELLDIEEKFYKTIGVEGNGPTATDNQREENKHVDLEPEPQPEPEPEPEPEQESEPEAEAEAEAESEHQAEPEKSDDESEKKSEHDAQSENKGSMKGSEKGSAKDLAKGSEKGSVKGSAKGSAKGSSKDLVKGSAKGSSKGSVKGSAKGSSKDLVKGSEKGSAKDLANASKASSKKLIPAEGAGKDAEQAAGANDDHKSEKSHKEDNDDKDPKENK